MPSPEDFPTRRHGELGAFCLADGNMYSTENSSAPYTTYGVTGVVLVLLFSMSSLYLDFTNQPTHGYN